MKLLKYWWHRLTTARSHPSWRVIYEDGEISHPLMRPDAKTRARLFGPGYIVYSRDEDGNVVSAAKFQTPD